MIKLNLGCNKVNIPGYTNIDIADFPHIDYKHDIKTLPMFNDNSVDEIYCSAVFQYFDREEGLQALQEWNRVLKVGGVLRLSTVDFRKLLEVYSKYDDLNKLIGPMYGKMPAGEQIIYHKTVYDRESLLNVLEKANFHNVVDYEWQNTIHANYDDQSQAYVPHMDKKNGILIMQNLEAIKK